MKDILAVIFWLGFMAMSLIIPICIVIAVWNYFGWIPAIIIIFFYLWSLA